MPLMPPNHRIDRSAKRQRRLVPVTLRVPAPGHAKRQTAGARSARSSTHSDTIVVVIIPSRLHPCRCQQLQRREISPKACIAPHCRRS